MMSFPEFPRAPWTTSCTWSPVWNSGACDSRQEHILVICHSRQGGDQNLWGRADVTILKVRNLNWLLNLWESYAWEIYPSLRKYRLCFSQISCKNVPCMWRYLASKDKWPVRHWYDHCLFGNLLFCFKFLKSFKTCNKKLSHTLYPPSSVVNI